MRMKVSHTGMLAAGRTGTARHLHGSAEVSTLGNVVSVSAAYWRL